MVLSGTVHRMCSDACFNRFRTVNNLSMAGCASCGSFCHSKPLLLKMDDGSKTLCNSECLAAFKEAGAPPPPHTPTLGGPPLTVLPRLLTEKQADSDVHHVPHGPPPASDGGQQEQRRLGEPVLQQQLRDGLQGAVRQLLR